MNKEYLEGQVSNAATAAGAFAADAKNQADGFVKNATATVEDVYGQARTQVRGAAADVTRTVEQQPLLALMAIGLVFGAVGWLLGRR